MQPEVPSIITISSHVAYGAVGNRIIVPALEALGISVTALSTVQLPWHPGMNDAFGKGVRIAPDDAAFARVIDNLCTAPWLGGIDGMITGYLGSAAQAEVIAKLVVALKNASPKALYLCDPVIGDNDGLYVPEVTAAAIRDHLWPLADVVTPNLFEFGWMTGQTSADRVDIIEAALVLAKNHVVVTSVGIDKNKIGNLSVSTDQSTMISHQALSPTPNGTGDMLAALFLGHLVKGESSTDALAKAASAVVAAIQYANSHHQPSLAPEHLRDALEQGLAEILVEKLD